LVDELRDVVMVVVVEEEEKEEEEEAGCEVEFEKVDDGDESVGLGRVISILLKF
jgi:hypothetical protein